MNSNMIITPKKIKKYIHHFRIIPDTHTEVTSLRADLHEQKLANIKLEKLVQSQLFGNNHENDSFYIRFENKFRGSETDIKKRQAYYLEFLSHLAGTRQKVVDIGCGRGEFLSLMADAGIDALGIDLNKVMVEAVSKKGLTAKQVDINDYLKTAKKGTIGAITGFHLVEHIPFSDLLILLRNCYRVLESDGVVIFETPNPESLLVGSHNFWTDPSHLNPIPPATLKFALESVGFEDVVIHRLHPTKDSPQTKGLSDDLKEIVERYYGARDYSVVATKKKAKQ